MAVRERESESERVISAICCCSVLMPATAKFGQVEALSEKQSGSPCVGRDLITGAIILLPKVFISRKLELETKPGLMVGNVGVPSHDLTSVLKICVFFFS